MIKRKNALKYVFVLFIVFSLLFTYLSFKINNRNPYFDHLSQSERSAICSATPEDLAKLYFESLHEKNYDLCLALFTEQHFKQGVNPTIIESLLLELSSKYRAVFAKSLIEPDINLEKISGLHTTDLTNEPIIGGSNSHKEGEEEYLLGVSFVLEKGRFLAPAPSSINVTRFVVLKPSFLYKCFLIDGIGTSP